MLVMTTTSLGLFLARLRARAAQVKGVGAGSASSLLPWESIVLTRRWPSEPVCDLGACSRTPPGALGLSCATLHGFSPTCRQTV
jgi:hypothetical protein